MNVVKRIFAKLSKDISAPAAPRLPLGYSGGSYINEKTSMQVAAFYRGIIYISSQMSKLPWHIKTEDNVIVNDDLSKLLRFAPNREMNSMFFRLLTIQMAIIHGNCYCEIERTVTGKPVALWPLPQGACEPVRTTDGTLYYRLDASHTVDGRERLLEPRDIFAVRNFHTRDGIVSDGVVAYAKDTLGISLGADKFANALYANGAMPLGYITSPTRLSDEAFKRLAKSWKENHGGRQSGGVAVLEDGSEYKPLSFPPEVLQFLESRKFSVIEIARFLGVPPQKLYDSESATYNNIEHANLEVVTDTLDSWARNLESETDVKLLINNKHTKAYFSDIDLRAVFRGDMTTRTAYYKGRMETGSISPNEIRALEGDAAYEGGDEYFIATNNYTPVSRMDEVIDATIANKNKALDSGTKKIEDEEASAKLTAAATKFLNK